MSEHVAITPIREICSPAAMADDASHAQGIEEFLDHIYAIDREVRLTERFDPGAAEPFNPGAKQPGAFTFDFGNIRSLLANWGYVQSARSITEPTRFFPDYTRAWMEIGGDTS